MMKPKKQVTFANNAEMIEINRFARPGLIWWTPDERIDMENDQHAALNFMNMMGNMDLVEGREIHCSRGLENYTMSGSSSVKKNRKKAVAAVMKEQSKQKKQQVTDELAIAKAYERQTIKVRETALERGLQDAKEAGRRPILSRSASVRSHSRPGLSKSASVRSVQSHSRRQEKKGNPKKWNGSDSSTFLTESCSSLDLSLRDVLIEDSNAEPKKKAQTKQRLKNLRLRWRAGAFSGQSSHAKATFAGAYDNCMF
jgi:hypothetical protein